MNFQHGTCPKLPWMVDFHKTDRSKVIDKQLDAAYASKSINHLSSLKVNSLNAVYRATKLICTITGYIQCDSVERLIGSGISGIRLIFPKFETKKAAELISKITVINEHYSKRIGRLNPLALILEINGPKVRIGTIKDAEESIRLEKGCTTKLTTDPTVQNDVTKDLIYVNYDKLSEVVQPGDKVVFDNGLVSLSALKIVESVVNCIVERAGDIISGEPLILPKVEIQDLSIDDKQMIEFAIQQNIDAVMISRVQSKFSVKEVKKILTNCNAAHIFVISNIDNAIAVDNVDDIIEISDGICLDCCKLMADIPREKVFLAEKSIIAKCIQAGKPIIITTLIQEKALSKAEICDTANSVMEAIDGFLLPDDISDVETITNIHQVCKEAEPAVYQRQLFEDLTDTSSLVEPIYSLAISAVHLSLKSNASAIICTTSSGRTARLLTNFRPRCPVIAITRHKKVGKQLSLFRGCDSVIYCKKYEDDWSYDIEQRLQLGVSYGKLMGYIHGNDVIVTISPSRPDSGFTNSIRLFLASHFDDIHRKSQSYNLHRYSTYSLY